MGKGYILRREILLMGADGLFIKDDFTREVFEAEFVYIRNL